MSFWDIFKKKKKPVMEFRVGEGLTPKQTEIAYQKIKTPDTAIQKAQEKTFWGMIKKEFSPRDEAVPVRRAFEVNPIQTKAPPIVTQLGEFGFRLLEAIPRAAATIGGELKAKGKATEVKANIDLRRLGFDTPEYKTAAKEQIEAIEKGENPWISGLRIMSNKTLDIAFGAQLATDLAKISTSVLLKGGAQARIEAQETLQAIEANQKAVFQRLKDAPLKEREEAMASILNTKKEAQKILDTQGVPTAFDRAKLNASRYTEVLSRETQINKDFWKNITKPDINLKAPLAPKPVLDAPQLPGYRRREGQAPAFGLSTEEIEPVGRGPLKPKIPEIDPKISKETFSSSIVPEIQNAFKEAQKGVVSEVTKKNTDIVISAVDRLIAEGKVRVVSRDGRDVFQVKKGNIWVNARDESSAVKKLTEKYKPKPKQYAPKDQEKLDFAKAQLEIVRERLSDHPARPLLKYIDRKEGQFEDFKNPNYAKTPRQAEMIKAKNKKIMDTAMSAFEGRPELADSFDNADTIKEVIEDYIQTRKVEKAYVATKNEILKTIKPIDQKANAKHISEFLPKVKEIDTTEGEGRSLEILVNQAHDILSGDPFPVNQSLPHVIEQTATKVQNKVNIIDTYLRTPFPVMQKIGFGKEAEELRDAMDAYWKELPTGVEKVSNWLKRLKDKDAHEAVFDWLDGKAITLPPKEKEVAMEIRRWLVELGNRLGLPADDRIKNYVTHLFLTESQMAEKEFDEELAKAIAGKLPKEVYDPFLEKRKGVKGYRRDLGAALDAYWKRAVRKVHVDPVLEVIQGKAGSSLEFSNIEKSQFQYLQKYISNINMRPSEAEEGIDNFVKSIIGYKLGQRPTTAVLRFLRQATFRGMLGLNPTSALRNLSQGINTYATLKEKYTAIGYMKLFQKGAGEELTREGVLNAGFVQDRALSSTKKIMEKMDKGLFFFFDRAEKINRGAAYFGAKSKALAAGKSEEEAIKYAKQIVRKTQFSYDSVDTPVGMSNDLAKTLFQFQTYTTKQLEFLAGMAKDRNFAGLLRYALAGMAFVYTIGKAFGMEPKELLPWYRFDTPPSLKAPVEVIKAAANAPDKYGNKRSLKQKLKDIGKSVIGLIPGGNQAKKTIQGIEAVNEGGSYTSDGKLQFKQGQSKAEIIQSILFGKYASQNAKDYFDGKSVSEKEYDRLKKLTPAEANAIMKDYKESRPSLYAAIKKLREDEKLGITDEEKKIRELGVQNMKRAEFIYKKVMKLKTAEEKNAYIKDLRKKKIITDEVLKQIKELKNQPISEEDKPGILEKFFSVPKAEAAGFFGGEEAPKNYYIRDNTISESDLQEAEAILFGEISNRSSEKQLLEAQTILNTAFNRMDVYRQRGNPKTLTEVLQMNNQYQAYKGKQYYKYKTGKTTELDKQKIAAIKKMIAKVKDGTFQNNVGKSVFYKHLSDGRILADNRKLFKDELVLK